ncbi:MAG: glycosyltransferase family 2 protein [Pirellula sp.]|jgi:GT2 family glycosyltransferase
MRKNHSRLVFVCFAPARINDCTMLSPPALSPDTPRISVIIPVFNGGDGFAQCLEAIDAATPRPDQILVVDDGSTDRSASLAREKGFHVLSTAGRTGPAEARNIGARHAIGEVLFFVDADCSVRPDVIGCVRSLLEDHPTIDAFVGSYDDAPTAKNLLSQYKNLLHHFTHQMSAHDGYTFWGACGVIRREAFQQMGGFDRTYTQASIEDIELGYRLKAAGKKILMCPELQVTHHKRWSPLKLLKTDLFLRAIPWSRLILKTGEMADSLNISRVARLRVALSGLIPMSLVLAIFFPPILWITLALVVLLLVADGHVLSWLYRKRGLGFTLAILPWHWFSHFYSGVGFALAIMMHMWEGLPTRRLQSMASSIAEPAVESASPR